MFNRTPEQQEEYWKQFPEAWQSIPAGSTCRLRGYTLVKIADSHCYDGIGNMSLFQMETGTIHHLTEFFHSASNSIVEMLDAFTPPTSPEKSSNQD